MIHKAWPKSYPLAPLSFSVFAAAAAPPFLAVVSEKRLRGTEKLWLTPLLFMGGAPPPFAVVEAEEGVLEDPPEADEDPLDVDDDDGKGSEAGGFER